MLCGGRSAERDVSCVSAAAILRNLGRHRPLLVRIDPRGAWRFQNDPRAFARHPKPFKYPFDRIPARLEPGSGGALFVGSGPGARRLRADVVFPALHGPFGEDGTVQGLLESVGVPYVGCGVLTSAVGMDKAVTKRLAAEAGLPMVPYAALEAGARAGLRQALKLRFPVFVKPARLGSSVGVYKVHRPKDLARAVRKAFRFDTTVLVEQGVDAREIECAVLGGGEDARASKVVGEIRPRHEFYSYAAKYLDPQGAELLVPAPVPRALSERVRRISVEAFRALGGCGLARVDFLLDRRTLKLYFNEINTMPGFTAISMYPRLWEASGLGFPALVEALLRLALRRHRVQSRLRAVRD